METDRLTPLNNINGLGLQMETEDIAQIKAMTRLPPDLKAKLLNPLVPREEKLAAVKGHEVELRGEREAVKAKLAAARAEYDHLGRLSAAGDEYVAWVNAGLRMERPDGSSLHQFLRSLKRREVLLVNPESKGTAYQQDPEYALSFSDCPNTFVVQHDWAGAFAGATDYAGGSFRLPYDDCVFEFRYSGRKVIALTRQIGVGWLSPDLSNWNNYQGSRQT